MTLKTEDLIIDQTSLVHVDPHNRTPKSIVFVVKEIFKSQDDEKVYVNGNFVGWVLLSSCYDIYDLCEVEITKGIKKAVSKKIS